MFTKEITETKTVIDTDKISTYDGIIVETEYAGEITTLAGVVLSVYTENFKLVGFRVGEKIDDRSLLVSVSAKDLSSSRAKIKYIERAGENGAVEA